LRLSKEMAKEETFDKTEGNGAPVAVVLAGTLV
jgi:hypothetical protein